MELFLLKVKHIYDEEFEECGIFSSVELMNEGKRTFLANKRKESFKSDEFKFSWTRMKLDELC